MRTWRQSFAARTISFMVALTLPLSAVADPTPAAETETTAAETEDPTAIPDSRTLKQGAVVIPEPSDAILQFLRAQPTVSGYQLNSSHFLFTRPEFETARVWKLDLATCNASLQDCEGRLTGEKPKKKFWQSKTGFTIKVGGISVAIVGAFLLGALN